MGDNPYALYGVGGVLVLIAGWLLTRVLGKKKANPRPLRGAAAAAAEEEVGDDDKQIEMEKEAEQYYGDAHAANAEQPHPLGSQVSDEDEMEQLRHHFDDGDADRFLKLAHSIHDKVPEDSPEWHEVSELGRQLLPGSPLFAAPEVQHVADHHVDDFFFGEESNSKPEVEEPNAHDKQIESLLNLDEPLEFEPHTEHTPRSDDLEELEFERELGIQGGSEPTDHTVVSTAESNKDEEANDRHVGLIDEDTISTRLDLARAYLDMGDPEGARSMLDEVLAEGNDTQKEEARKLLSELS